MSSIAGTIPRPIHHEVQAAITTRRPQLAKILRARLLKDGSTTHDVLLLLNAVEVLIEELFESERKLSELDRVLKDQRRVLRGAADQAEALRELIRTGGTYKNARERDQNDDE